MGKSLIITTGGGTDIEEGNPNALPQFVLSGYTFYANMDEPIIGEMENHSESSDILLGPEEESSIPLGYHSGEQTISTEDLLDHTQATAEESEVLVDYRGWNSGTLVMGSMANQEGLTDGLQANGTYAIPQGWHNGQGAISQTLDAQAATNITPGTTQKTIIAASKWASGNQTVLGNGNLVAGNIKKDVTIFGVKGTYRVIPNVSLYLGYPQKWNTTYISSVNYGGYSPGPYNSKWYDGYSRWVEYKISVNPALWSGIKMSGEARPFKPYWYNTGYIRATWAYGSNTGQCFYWDQITAPWPGTETSNGGAWRAELSAIGTIPIPNPHNLNQNVANYLTLRFQGTGYQDWNGWSYYVMTIWSMTLIGRN